MREDLATDERAALDYCTPGQPDRISAKEGHFARIAEDASVAHRDLSVLVDRDLCEIWEGQLANSYSEMIDGEVLEAIGKLQRSFEHASTALGNYAVQLAAMQDEVKAAVGRAVDATQAKRESTDTADHARREETDFARVARNCEVRLRSLDREFQATLSVRQPEDLDYDRRYRSWCDRWYAEQHALNKARRDGARSGAQARRYESDAQDACERIGSAVRWMEEVKAQRVSAEDRAAADLEEAGRLGIQNRNVFQKAWDWISDLENLDKLLENIASVCGVLAILVNIIPGVGQALSAVLMTVALVATVAGTIVTAARWVKGDVSGWTALGDAAFCAIDLFTAGTTSKLAKASLKAPAPKALWKRVVKKVPGWNRVPKLVDFAKPVIKSVKTSREAGENVLRTIPKAFSRDEFLYSKIKSVGAEYANSSARSILVDGAVEAALESDWIKERAKRIIPQPQDVVGFLGDNRPPNWVSGVPGFVFGADALVTSREPLDLADLGDDQLECTGSS